MPFDTPTDGACCKIVSDMEEMEQGVKGNLVLAKRIRFGRVLKRLKAAQEKVCKCGMAKSSSPPLHPPHQIIPPTEPMRTQRSRSPEIVFGKGQLNLHGKAALASPILRTPLLPFPAPKPVVKAPPSQSVYSPSMTTPFSKFFAGEEQGDPPSLLIPTINSIEPPKPKIESSTVQPEVQETAQAQVAAQSKPEKPENPKSPPPKPVEAVSAKSSASSSSWRIPAPKVLMATSPAQCKRVPATKKGSPPKKPPGLMLGVPAPKLTPLVKKKIKRKVISPKELVHLCVLV